MLLIALGKARALPGRRDDLVAAARAVTADTRSDEGCESYGFYAALDDEEAILSIEIWRDQAALDAHMTHQHTQDFLDAASGLIDGAPSMSFHQVRPA